MESSSTFSIISSIVSIISSIAIGVLTWCLVIYTKKYVYLTEQISSTNAKMVEEQNRPFVVAQIFAENTSLILSVNNVGNRPAKDIEIIFNPDIDVVIQKNDLNEPIFEIRPMLKQSFIPPAYAFRNILYNGADYFKRDDAGQHIFEVSVLYSDESGKKFEEKYMIDFRNFYFLKHAAEFSDNHQFAQTHKEIKKLREELIKAINNLKH